MTMTLAELLKDSAYKLSQFKPSQIDALQDAITLKDAVKKPTPYVTCLVRGKTEARTQRKRRITLIGLKELFDLWDEHYDKLTDRARRRLPSRSIRFLAPGG
jgi:hypothetical protein